jgi:prephenate dehydrogenase
MPLIVSAAMVEAAAGGLGQQEHEDWRAAEVLAATGWAGMTRLARGEPAMGAGIAATNSEAIAGRLKDLRAVIDLWLVDLEREGGPDADKLLERFTSARERLVEADRK